MASNFWSKVQIQTAKYSSAPLPTFIRRHMKRHPQSLHVLQTAAPSSSPVVPRILSFSLDSYRAKMDSVCFYLVRLSWLWDTAQVWGTQCRSNSFHNNNETSSLTITSSSSVWRCLVFCLKKYVVPNEDWPRYIIT